MSSLLAMPMEAEPLAPGVVHLWRATTESLDPRSTTYYFSKFLSSTEKIQFQSYKSLAAQQEYLLGRLTLRQVLSLYYPHIVPQKWNFKINAYGKPGLGDGSQIKGLNFNLSHSGGRVVLALTLEADIGLDIEVMRDGLDFEKLAQEYFSPRERDHFIASSRPHLNHIFYRLWTLKEAYIKARGLGLTIPLNQFALSWSRGQDVNPQESSSVPSKISISFEDSIDDNPSLWWFTVSDYYQSPLALAVKRKGLPERVITFDFKLR